MPLSAFVGDAEIVAPALPPSQWTELYEQIESGLIAARLPGCGLPGYARTTDDLQHFAHSLVDDECPMHRGETQLSIKATWWIAQCAQDNGWQVALARHDGGWAADVLIERDGFSPLAIVVKGEGPRADEIRTQAQRMESSGVQGVWFGEGADPMEFVGLGVPVFGITQDRAGTPRVNFCDAPVPLPEAMRDFLAGRVQRRDVMTSIGEAECLVAVYEITCHACNQRSAVWDVPPVEFGTACGITANTSTFMHSTDRPEAQAKVLVAANWAASDQGLQPAKISMRYSKTLDGTYQAFSCPHCSVLFGDFPLSEFFTDSDPFTCLWIDRHVSVYEKHWCRDSGWGFCGDTADSSAPDACDCESGPDEPHAVAQGPEDPKPITHGGTLGTGSSSVAQAHDWVSSGHVPSDRAQSVAHPRRRKRSWLVGIVLGVFVWLGITFLTALLTLLMGRSRYVDVLAALDWVGEVLTVGAVLTGVAVAVAYRLRNRLTKVVAIGLPLSLVLFAVVAGFIPPPPSQRALAVARDISTHWNASQVKHFCEQPAAISRIRRERALTSEEVQAWRSARHVVCEL